MKIVLRVREEIASSMFALNVQDQLIDKQTDGWPVLTHFFVRAMAVTLVSGASIVTVIPEASGLEYF